MSEPERFRDADDLDFNSDLLAFVSGDNEWVGIQNPGGLTVPEARALYQWLGKVLPEEKS